MDEGRDPRAVPQLGLLREPRLRGRGGCADLLLEAREPAVAVRVRPPRRSDPGAVRLRPPRRARASARPANPGPGRDARPGRDRQARARRRGQGPARPQAGSAVHRDQRAVLLRIRPRSAHPRIRGRDGPLRRPEGLHDDPAASAAPRAAGDQGHVDRARRPRRRRHLHRSGERRDQGDGSRGAGPPRQPVQPALPGTTPARIDLQDVRPRRSGRAGHGSRRHVLRVGAVHVQPDHGRKLRRRWLVVRQDVRLDVRRLDIGLPRDAPLGQLGLRAAHPRRHPRVRREDGPEARREDPARRERLVRPGDGPRLDRCVAARHGLRVCDARGRRHLLGADGHPAGDPPRRHGGQGDRLGQAATQARDPGRRRIRRNGDPRGQRALRDGDTGGLRPPGGGQDRYHGRARGCVVRGLHPGARVGRVDRVHAG